MFKQVLIAVAVAATMSGGIAAAKEDPTPATDSSTPAPDKKRYCIKAEPVTGTMLQAQQCKTLAQWKALGVDPTKKGR